jgi:hypothetical protein
MSWLFVTEEQAEDRKIEDEKIIKRRIGIMIVAELF